MTNIRDWRPDSMGIDQSDMPPTRVCACGSELFRTVVSFDEDYEIASYALDAECLECGAPVKIVCPLDLTEKSYDW